MLFQTRPLGQILGTIEHPPVSLGDDAKGGVPTHADQQPQPQPHSGSMVDVLQGAIDIAAHYVDRPYLDSMALGVLHELAWAVEAQRLRVQHRRQKLRWVMAFDPATGIASFWVSGAPLLVGLKSAQDYLCMPAKNFLQ